MEVLYLVFTTVPLSLLGCYNRILLTVSYEQQKFIPHSSRGWSWRSRYPQIPHLVRVPLLVYIFTWWKGWLEPSRVSFIRTLIPLMKPPSSRSNHSPHSTSKYQLHWGLGFQYMSLEDINMQPVAHCVSWNRTWSTVDR